MEQMSWKLKDEELEFIDENEEQIKSYVGKKADDYKIYGERGRNLILQLFFWE